MGHIAEHPEMHSYVVEKLAQNVGSFLYYFLHACLCADHENFEVLKPALEQIMKKYPLRFG